MEKKKKANLREFWGGSESGKNAKQKQREERRRTGSGYTQPTRPPTAESRWPPLFSLADQQRKKKKKTLFLCPLSFSPCVSNAEMSQVGLVFRECPRELVLLALAERERERASESSLFVPSKQSPLPIPVPTHPPQTHLRVLGQGPVRRPTYLSAPLCRPSCVFFLSRRASILVHLGAYVSVFHIRRRGDETWAARASS